MEEKGEQKPLWLTAAPALFLLFWATGFPTAKLALEDAGPLSLLCIRYALIVVILYPLFIILRPPVPRNTRGWVNLVVSGTLIQIFYFGFSYLAFHQGVPVGTVALIVSLQPVLVALSAPMITGETIGKLRWFGFLLGFAGTAVVIVSNSVVGLVGPLGIGYCIAALLGMSAAALYEKRFGTSEHPVTANLVQYAVGFAGTFPLVFFIEGMQVNWTIQFSIVIGYLVVFNSLVAITLLLAMLRVGEAARVSALLFLVPPLSAVIAWFLIGEKPSPLVWTGLVIATVGVGLAQSCRQGETLIPPVGHHCIKWDDDMTDDGFT